MKQINIVIFQMFNQLRKKPKAKNDLLNKYKIKGTDEKNYNRNIRFKI